MLLNNSTRVEESQRDDVEETEHDWVRAHAALSRLARERAAADAEEGRWLLCAFRSAAHVHMGFGSFGGYVERLFGYRPRSTQEKLRVAEALEDLPLPGRALDGGSLGWSAVRELTRVAVADTEQAWLDVAQNKTVRQLEELVAGKNLGDEPSAPNRPEARRHTLRFDVAPETFALVREAISWLRRRSPDSLDDDAALLSMARLVLGEHREDGRASYQIALTVCAACGAGQQRAGGELIPVGPEIVAMAPCDGQHLGHIAPLAANENALPAPVQAQAGDCPTASPPPRDASTVNVCEPAHAHTGATSEHGHTGAAVTGTTSAHAHTGATVAGATADHALTGATGACADAGATDAAPDVRALRHGTFVPSRATQPIPPALRRAALLRDQHCCRVPGCKTERFSISTI